MLLVAKSSVSTWRESLLNAEALMCRVVIPHVSIDTAGILENQRSNTVEAMVINQLQYKDEGIVSTQGNLGRIR